ncbi:MAG: UDP-N-acetylmuramate dehydrogenase, partial [Sulfurovaceae bacterium]|nr:UDP-N-acetylmuramate dehydrogenase [Sulfurovaceae bacterium]
DSVCIDGLWRKKEEIEHGYRFAKLGGVATEARFRIKHGFDTKQLESLIALRANQPKEPSAGSLFKNPEGDHAGRLIEAVGLKGMQIGGMAWSEVHANFLVNKGYGTFSEAMELINLAKQKVQSRFGIALQEEVKIL